MIVHLRLGMSPGPNGQPGSWVSECGHYVTGSTSTGEKALVTCKSCKRTRAYKRLP